MSLGLVAVQGFTRSTVVVVGVNPQGVVVETGVPSAKVKAGGQGVCKDGFGLSVSAVTDPGAGATIPDPGPFSAQFSATATKVKADGTLVLRQDDQTGIISATPKIPGSPPTPFPVQFRYKIAVAGQTKVKAQ